MDIKLNEDVTKKAKEMINTYLDDLEHEDKIMVNQLINGLEEQLKTEIARVLKIRYDKRMLASTHRTYNAWLSDAVTDTVEELTGEKIDDTGIGMYGLSKQEYKIDKTKDDD